MNINILKWCLVILLVSVAVAGEYLLKTQMFAYRVAGVGVLLAIACIAFISTRQGQLVWSFVCDAKIELRKVIWPSRRETMQATLVVMGMVVVMALVLWLVDSLLMYVMAWTAGQGGGW